MDEITLKQTMRQMGLDIAKEQPLESRALNFERALKIVIPPRDQSDRTSFRRIAGWLKEGCEAGRFHEHVIFRRVLDFAVEASGPGSRNPAAVFTSILKKELGYKK